MILFKNCMVVLKHRALVLLGIALVVITSSIMMYSSWKMLFYFEAASYGKRLTQELERSIKNDIFSPDEFRQKSSKKFNFEGMNFFPREFSYTSETISTEQDCQAMTDVHDFANYSASVRCSFGDHVVHYHFRKNYDHPIYLSLIFLGTFFAAYRISRLIITFEKLKQENFHRTLELTREKAVFEVGAKLVHDLKKGVLSQLNSLAQEYGEDLALEMAQPDFKPRLEKKLKEHFKAIEFLNKYMSLLMVNLKRRPEIHWLPLNKSKLEDYFQMVFSPVSKTHQNDSQKNSGVKFIYHSENRKSEMISSSKDFHCWVPEMSFFRILKNISENYNAYGQGPLVLDFSVIEEKSQIILTAENEIRTDADNASSTGLGLVIIKQLILDNFGEAKTSVSIFNDGKHYKLTLVFPQIRDKESVPHG